jgi:hypothetical protein
MEWSTNEREDLAHAIVYLTKTKSTGLSGNNRSRMATRMHKATPKNGRAMNRCEETNFCRRAFSKKRLRDVAGASSRSNWRIWIGDKHSQEVTVDASRCERG